jgi:hypothetical protein
MFCKAYIRAGHLLLKPQHDIVAMVDPETSNFRYSRERWRLIPEKNGTRMLYDFEMEPDFWVPPLIGPYVMKKVLLDGGRDAIDRIEELALSEEPGG